MKLKKIASLALAGIMAVSMLTACGEGTGNGNSGSSSSGNTNTSTGISAEVLNMSAFRSSKVVTAVDSSSLNDAVKAAAAIAGSGNSAATLNDLTELKNNTYGSYSLDMLNAAKAKMGTAKYVYDETDEWKYVQNIADNDDHTVYNMYVIAQNLGDEVIKQKVANKLEGIYNAIEVVNPKLADSYNYEVSVAMADWQVGKDADSSKDGVIVGIAVTLRYDAAAFN